MTGSVYLPIHLKPTMVEPTLLRIEEHLIISLLLHVTSLVLW